MNERSTKRGVTAYLIWVRLYDDQRNVEMRFSSPSIETHLAVVKGFPTKKFLPKCINKKSSPERRYVVR